LKNYFYNNGFISSPELKARLSYSDHVPSVVCRPSICKFFLWTTSSTKPLNWFEPNLVGSIFGEWGFKFANIKGLAPIGAP